MSVEGKKLWLGLAFLGVIVVAAFAGMVLRPLVAYGGQAGHPRRGHGVPLRGTRVGQRGD